MNSYEVRDGMNQPSTLTADSFEVDEHGGAAFKAGAETVAYVSHPMSVRKVEVPTSPEN